MSNIALLPQLSSKTSFSVPQNANWTDAFLFALPGQPAQPIQLTGSIALGSSVFTTASTYGVTPGMPINAVPGLVACFAGAVSNTTVALVDVHGAAVNATASNAEAQLVFNPIPIDLTGISFTANLRLSPGGTQLFLMMSTQLSVATLVNGGTTGVLNFNVPFAQLQQIPPGTYVMDIVANDNQGNVVNLFPQGPATVNVWPGVVNPAP